MSEQRSSQERSWSILELLQWTEQHFRAQGIESAKLDAECLLAHALGTQRLQLYVDFEKPVHPDERSSFRELVVRRARDRVPVSQLLGTREFWSLELQVTPLVLSPRPETETLVEAALARMPERDGAYRVLEIGTGSGAVALAIRSERPQASVTATDISSEALQIARENAEELHLIGGLRLLEGDLFGPVRGEQFDLVISNPPYVARRDAAGLPPELAHEPEIALFGGDDGYAVLERLVGGLEDALVPGGWVALELAPSQAGRVSGWLATAGFESVEVLRDLARRERVVAGRRATGGAPRSEHEETSEREDRTKDLERTE